MKRLKKLSLRQLFLLIEPRRRAVCMNVVKEFEVSFESFPGSITKHQWWKGGYRDHIEEVMNIAYAIYRVLAKRRKLPFSLADALFVLFLHDFDKLQRYGLKSKRTRPRASYTNQYYFTLKRYLLARFRYRFRRQEENALKYTHGEGGDYHPTKRIMLPLATFVHCCDIISARLWYDKGRDDGHW